MAGQVKFILDAETAKAVRGFLKLREEQKKNETQFGRTTRAAKKQNAVFGRFSQQVTAIATGYLSVQAAAGLASRAIRAVVEEQEKAAEVAREARGGVGLLKQVARDEAHLQALIATGKEMRARGGSPDLDSAMRDVFRIESAGLMDFKDTFIDLQRKNVIDEPGLFAKGISTLLASRGAEETGDVEQIMSKAFAASKFNPAEVEQLLEAAARGGGFARTIGVSDEAMLAAAAISSEASGEARVGGTRSMALMRSLSQKEEFIGAGMTLREMIEDILSRHMSAVQLQAFIGESRAFQGFQDIAGNLAEFDKILGEVNAANSKGVLASKLAMGQSIPELGAAQSAEAARGQLEVARFDTSELRSLIEAARTAREAQLVASGQASAVVGRRANDWVVDVLASREQTLEAMVSRSIAQNRDIGGDPSLNDRILRALERMDVNIELMATAREQAQSRRAHTE